jgi:broad-specificity NMP kinase
VELTPDNWRAEIARACREVVEKRGRALLCVTGRAGAGKSTYGRLIRKGALPGFPPRRVAVIDDGVMSVTILGFFQRRVRHRSSERDELAPFARHLRGKQLVVYVASRPEVRLSCCDVALLLRCRDDIRLRRLRARERDAEKRFQASLGRAEAIALPAGRTFELVTG